MDIQEICGNEHAKRAMEIALVGDFPIEFIGMSEAKRCLAAYNTARYPDHASEGDPGSSVVFPCPCGNFGDQQKTCTCKIKELQEHWKLNALTQPTLTTYTKRPPADTLIAHLDPSKRGETTADMMRRVRSAQRHTPKEYNLNKDLFSFLKAAIERFSLSQDEVEFTIDVSRAIARLSQADSILIQHLAEALQYRRTGGV